MLSYCLLASIVSAEKSAVNFIGFPFLVTSHFSLVAFKNFSLFFISFVVIYLYFSLHLFYLEFTEFPGCVGYCF